MSGLLDMMDYEAVPRKPERISRSRGALYRSALRDGMTIEELADEEGSSITGIRSALSKAGYDPYEFLTERERRIKFLSGPLCQGTAKDVADILDMPQGTVENIRNRVFAR